MACTKKRFPTEKEAKYALVDVMIKHNRGQNKRKECRYYRCANCHGWHLTSQPFDPAKHSASSRPDPTVDHHQAFEA